MRAFGPAAVLGVLCCALVLGALARRGDAAGPYRELPVDTRQMQQPMREATAILSGRAQLAGNEQTLRTYTRQVVSLMTHVNRLDRITSDRRGLMGMIRGAQSPQASAIMSAEAFRLCSGIVQPTYTFHPAVKYNAMLIIGQLNENEGSPSSGVPPKPLPAALDVMYREFINAEQTDAVKVAALVGLLRFAQLGQFHPDIWGTDAQKSAGRKRAVQSKLLEMAQAKSVPEQRSSDGHHWLRRRAMDVLGELRDAGSNGGVVKALDAILQDPDEPISVRISAADALSKLPLSPDVIDPLRTGRGLGQLAVDVARDHARFVKAELRERMEHGAVFTGYGKGTLGAGYGSGYGGGGGGYGYGYGYSGGGATGGYSSGPGPSAGRGGYPPRGGSGYSDGYSSAGRRGGRGGGRGGARGGRDADVDAYGMEIEEPDDPLVEATRRYMKSRLRTIQVTIKGNSGQQPGGILALAQQDAQKSFLNDIATRVAAMETHLDKENSPINTMMQGVVDEMKALAATIGQKLEEEDTESVTPEAPQEVEEGAAPGNGAGPPGQAGPQPGPAGPRPGPPGPQGQPGPPDPQLGPNGPQPNGPQPNGPQPPQPNAGPRPPQQPGPAVGPNAPPQGNGGPQPGPQRPAVPQ